MFVIKRNGDRQEVDFNQILDRIKGLSSGLNTTHLDLELVSKRVIEGLYDGIHTRDIDKATEFVAASMTTRHHDYSRLAARIAVSSLHKETSESFVECMEQAYNTINKKSGIHAPVISLETLTIARTHKEKIEKVIDHSLDYTSFDFFGIKTLEKGYLLSDSEKKILERPQYMYMRVAIGVCGDDIEGILQTYEALSKKQYTHASPTLFNGGTSAPQLASCFLLTMAPDSIHGIFKTLKDMAHISARGGGMSVAISGIRAKGSYIKKSRGTAAGIIPMLRVINETARYVDQGGKRKGAFAVYLEPWYLEVEAFLDLKKNHGAEELRARDLFYALWISDVFMKRVEEDGMWSLFSPDEVPNLFDSYGEEHRVLYEKYEKEGRAQKTIKARDLWRKIVDAQIQTGTPYMLYKDAANEKSNQQNLGTIHSSNLCCEIIQYSSKDEIAVCNIASLTLNSFVREDKTYDFEALHKTARLVTRNLNNIIDRTLYPVKETEHSNMKHRPIGIGVQGLADTFAMLKMSFDDESAKRLNKDIFETIYHGAMTESLELAKKDGAYESFKGSPLSKGLFQFDLWGVIPDSGLWNWSELRDSIVKHGARNSLLIAPMPTATTAQIVGNTEAFEPFGSNMYVRRVLSGEFIVLNRHLVNDLIEIGLWSEDIRKKLIAEQGSIQNIHEIPEEIRHRYRTVWEISQKSIIDMAADRAPFICQSQSMNIHIADATSDKVTSMHFYAWKKGLKTGMYYLRNTPARSAVQFTVDNSQKNKAQHQSEKQSKAEEPKKQYTIVSSQTPEDDDDVCISCSG